MAVTVDIRDGVTPVLNGLVESLAPSQVNPAIGTAVKKLFQSHFLALPSNRQNWPTTNFWPRAAKATAWSELPDGVLITVAQQGVRQRLEGGEIRPVNTKYLTIPARHEAYGKRAREFHNLVPAFRRSGGRVRAWALVEAPSQAVSFGRQRKDGRRKIKAGDTTGGGVYYWLVKTVTQRPDPTVIPSDDQIAATATETVARLVARRFGRQL